MDGAHNLHGTHALVKTLDMLGLRDFDVIFGVLRDKDYWGMVRMLMPYVRRWFILTPPSKRALNPDKLAAVIRQHGGRHVEILDDKEEVGKIIGSTEKLLITGSLYLVGDLRRLVYNLIGG